MSYWFTYTVRISVRQLYRVQRLVSSFSAGVSRWPIRTPRSPEYAAACMACTPVTGHRARLAATERSNSTGAISPMSRAIAGPL